MQELRIQVVRPEVVAAVAESRALALFGGRERRVRRRAKEVGGVGAVPELREQENQDGEQEGVRSDGYSRPAAGGLREGTGVAWCLSVRSGPRSRLELLPSLWHREIEVGVLD